MEWIGTQPVTIRLLPAVVAPGGKLSVVVGLAYPTDVFLERVEIQAVGVMTLTVNDVTGNDTFTNRFYADTWLVQPNVTMRHQELVASFNIPPDVPAGYGSKEASIIYELVVEIIARGGYPFKEKYAFRVAKAPEPPPPARPFLIVTSKKGPVGDTPFMELALDASHVAIGDVVSGSVSLQNLRDRRVRGVDITLVETETLKLPRDDVRRVKRYRFRVHRGSPKEGVAIPFRIGVPEPATPTFSYGPLSVTTEIVARAEVAWSDDVMVRGPVLIAPRATERRQPNRRDASPIVVGNQRQALNWQKAAARTGLSVDADGQRMRGQRGGVSIEISGEDRESSGPWTIAKLAWPSLGLDLEVRERRWLVDALTLNMTARPTDIVKVGDDRIDDRLSIRVRERAQGALVLTPLLFAEVMWFLEVSIDDYGARLASPGSPQAFEKVVELVTEAIAIADAFEAVRQSIPPPALFANDLPSWQAVADRLHGRLERGRMWIHDARVGIDVVEIGCQWTHAGLYVGSIVRVAIDPPLALLPADVEDPSISASARTMWRELMTKSRNMIFEKHAITIELEGKLSDPHLAIPIVDLVVGLRRALVGAQGGGPFR